MASCLSQHPVDPTLHCNRPFPTGQHQHESHSAFSVTEDRYVYWINDDYKEPERLTSQKAHLKRKSTLRNMAEKIRKS